MSTKSKFDPETPEWQLEQNMIGSERAANAAQADADRYLLQAQKLREKADRYRDALARLTATVK
jgi:hypothetical protein